MARKVILERKDLQGHLVRRVRLDRPDHLGRLATLVLLACPVLLEIRAIAVHLDLRATPALMASLVRKVHLVLKARRVFKAVKDLPGSLARVAARAPRVTKVHLVLPVRLAPLADLE